MKTIEVKSSSIAQSLTSIGKTIRTVGVVISIAVFCYSLYLMMDYEDGGGLLLLYAILLLVSFLAFGYICSGLGELVQNSNSQLQIKIAELQKIGEIVEELPKVVKSSDKVL